MSKGRYEVLVKRSRKVLERHYFNDYDVCMGFLDKLEYECDDDSVSIEYRDLNPFNKG
jgi:hypothetical protein